MPNWCATSINILGDYEELVELAEHLKEWTSKNYIENGFGKNWLGNILGNSGVDTYRNGDFKYNCRGSMSWYGVDGGKLKIETETAWSPMIQMWVAICDTFLSDYDLFYIADESGTELYWSNNPEVYDTYVVCVERDHDKLRKIGLPETLYDVSEPDVVDILQTLLDSKSTEVEVLLDELHDSDMNDCIMVYKYEHVPISELD